MAKERKESRPPSAEWSPWNNFEIAFVIERSLQELREPRRVAAAEANYETERENNSFRFSAPFSAPIFRWQRRCHDPKIKATWPLFEFCTRLRGQLRYNPATFSTDEVNCLWGFVIRGRNSRNAFLASRAAWRWENRSSGMNFTAWQRRREKRGPPTKYGLIYGFSPPQIQLMLMFEKWCRKNAPAPDVATLWAVVVAVLTAWLLREYNLSLYLGLQKIKASTNPFLNWWL